MLNGAMIALGALAIIDNVLFHWVLQVYRAVPGPWALPVELALVIVCHAGGLAGIARAALNLLRLPQGEQLIWVGNQSIHAT
jgi:hypothetical protein